MNRSLFEKVGEAISIFSTIAQPTPTFYELYKMND